MKMKKKAMVLVVEDEADIREGVTVWLEMSGFDVCCRNDGRDCAKFAATRRPSAILVDVRMPNMGGMEALNEIRRQPSTSDIPVIMLSADLRDEQRALDAGASYFVPKPYNGKQLASIVKLVTNREMAECSC